MLTATQYELEGHDIPPSTSSGTDETCVPSDHEPWTFTVGAVGEVEEAAMCDGDSDCWDPEDGVPPPQPAREIPIASTVAATNPGARARYRLPLVARILLPSSRSALSVFGLLASDRPVPGCRP